MRILLFSFVSVLFIGCAPTRRIVATTDTTAVIIRDSIIFRDSIIMVQLPQESSEARLPDNDTSVLETSIARSAAWIDNGTLFHTLHNKHEPLLPVNIKLPTRLHSEKGYAIRIQTNTVTVPRDLTAWQSFSMVLGRIALAVIFTAVFIRILRKKL